MEVFKKIYLVVIYRIHISLNIWDPIAAIAQLTKENQKKLLNIIILKIRWLYSNIRNLGKLYFSLIIDIIDEYIAAITIRHRLRKRYNKYKYI